MAQKITLKFKRILMVRVVLLAMLALLTVLVSAIVLEQFLIKSALTKEADYFWNRYQVNDSATPPDTWNLKSLLIDGERQYGSIGDIDTSKFSDTEFGFVHELDQPGYALLYKTERDGKQLFLEFNGENVRKLAFFLGIVPLTFFLLLSYLIGYFFYKRTTKALSPIIWLADKFDQFDPLSKDLPDFNLDDMPRDADWETSVLANSLGEYLERIKDFVTRERAFTRDVSHELRTPLTVMGMALDMIEVDGNLNERDAKGIKRIRTASKDMKELVEVFLILARESSKEMEASKVWVGDLVDREVTKNKALIGEKSLELSVSKQHNLVIETSEKIVEVLLGNLIRNAIIYTEKGSVKITINADSVEVEDTGIGMNKEQVEQIYKPFFRGGKRPSGGHGVGLTIVKRIADRFDWRVDMESELGKGTKVTVKF